MASARALDHSGNEIGEETAIKVLTPTIGAFREIHKNPTWLAIAEKGKPADTPRNVQEAQGKRLLEIAQASVAERDEKTMKKFEKLLEKLPQNSEPRRKAAKKGQGAATVAGSAFDFGSESEEE